MSERSGTTFADLAPETARPAAAPAPEPSAAVSVDIYDQIYHLRGSNPAYIDHLAHIVDSKMRAVSAHGNTVDSLRVAVLAALNIADELATLRQRYETLAAQATQSQRNLQGRAGSLNHLLDEVLTDPSARKVG